MSERESNLMLRCRVNPLSIFKCKPILYQNHFSPYNEWYNLITFQFDNIHVEFSCIPATKSKFLLSL